MSQITSKDNPTAVFKSNGQVKYLVEGTELGMTSKVLLQRNSSTTTTPTPMMTTSIARTKRRTKVRADVEMMKPFHRRTQITEKKKSTSASATPDSLRQITPTKKPNNKFKLWSFGSISFFGLFTFKHFCFIQSTSKCSTLGLQFYFFGFPLIARMQKVFLH